MRGRTACSVAVALVLAAAVIVTTVLVPVLTAWTARRFGNAALRTADTEAAPARH